MKHEFKNSLKPLIIPLLRFLKQQSRPVHAKEICSFFRIGERDLRLLINYIRNRIDPHVCSNFDTGYFYENDNEKIINSLKDKQALAFDIINTCNQQLKLLREEK